ncbi:MAG: hypothetical protein JAY74_11595, partial [Candidatus Thiodiazotropha taylori]|nr:hypothetical protein [Candidatus Thiodiazotropha taylori]
MAFQQFRALYFLPDLWPIPPSQLTLFFSYCFAKGYAPSTLNTYASGLSFFHKLYNLTDPTEFFVVKKLLEGCKRLRKRRDVRAPISKPILVRICSVLPAICASNYETLLF